jgi:hypothetical protein
MKESMKQFFKENLKSMERIDEENELKNFWKSYCAKEEGGDQNLQAVSLIQREGRKNTAMKRIDGLQEEDSKISREDIAKYQSSGGANPMMQLSPVYHTSMLYWAAKSSSIDVNLMKEIMNNLEAYPEGPVCMDGWRTPCHAAAEIGDTSKLKILMAEVNRRY